MTQKPEFIIENPETGKQKKPVIVSVVSPEEIFQSHYSFLESEYTVFSFLDGGQAIKSEHFFWTHILLIDSNPVINENLLAKYLFDRNTDAKIFTAWDREKDIEADILPWIYYIYRRPFDRDEIRAKIDEASRTLLNHEKRKEPRVNISVPVDLYFKKEFWSTTTVNLSLNGMQTSWSKPQLGTEMKEIFNAGTSPVSYARLKLTDRAGKRTDLEMNVSMKYLSPPNRTGTSLLGFQFKNTDLGSASRLYDTLTA